MSCDFRQFDYSTDRLADCMINRSDLDQVYFKRGILICVNCMHSDLQVNKLRERTLPTILRKIDAMGGFTNDNFQLLISRAKQSDHKMINNFLEMLLELRTVEDNLTYWFILITVMFKTLDFQHFEALFY